MIDNKRIEIIVGIAVVCALIISATSVVFGNIQEANGGFSSQPLYATKLFGQEVISIKIIAEDEEWQVSVK